MKPGSITLARVAGRAARATGLGGGTSLPGKVLLRTSPDAVATLAGRLSNGTIAVSATNGKTTTSALLAAILDAAGRSTVHNVQGANMAGGITSALLGATGRRGAMRADTGLFEVDEFWLDQVGPALSPRVLVLGNLFRDQLDRYGELETIAERWRRFLDLIPETNLVANADDPLVADLGSGRSNVTFFGVADRSLALGSLPHASDSTHCRRCGTRLVYDTVLLGHLGHYHCPGCALRRPEPTIFADNVVLDGARGSQFTLRTPMGMAEIALAMPGLYNIYNAVAAAAAAVAAGLDLRVISEGLQAARPSFGRAETIDVDGSAVSLMLIKNPTGANEVLRTLALEPQPVDVVVLLNDKIADGRDVSWIWDADFELIVPNVRRVICGGTRAIEIAVRLKYAGLGEAQISVVDGIAEPLDAALRQGSERIHVLPTYTAMLSLRDELARRGLTAGTFT